MLASSKRPPSVLFVFLIFWTFALGTAVFVQKVFLTVLFPQFADANGLLLNTDSIGYHQQATTMAANIIQHGWSAWELAPNGWPMIGIAGAIYSVFSADPLFVAPLSTASHAMGGMCLYLLARQFSDDWRVSLLAASPFVLFPSAAMWYSQLLKDGFFNAGVLLFALGVCIICTPRNWGVNMRSNVAGFCIILMGYMAMGVMRPYALNMALAAFVLVCLVLSVSAFIYGARGVVPWRRIASIIVLFLAIIASQAWTKINVGETVISTPANVSVVARASLAERFWNEVAWLPASVQRQFAIVAGVRHAYITGRPDAASTIDRNIQFQNALEVISYAPRAVQIALFSPFPDFWLSSGEGTSATLMRRASAAEMALSYIILMGVPFAFYRYWRRPEYWCVLTFVGSIMLVLTIATPNLGTLYRIRYPYYMTILMFGVLGWSAVLERARAAGWFPIGKTGANSKPVAASS